MTQQLLKQMVYISPDHDCYMVAPANGLKSVPGAYCIQRVFTVVCYILGTDKVIV